MKLLKFCFLLSLGALIILTIIDLSSGKGWNILDNAYQAVLLGAVYAFISWAFGSKKNNNDNNEKLRSS